MLWCPQPVLPLFGPLPADRVPAAQERCALFQRHPQIFDMLKMQELSSHLLRQEYVYGLRCCSV